MNILEALLISIVGYATIMCYFGVLSKIKKTSKYLKYMKHYAILFTLFALTIIATGIASIHLLTAVCIVAWAWLIKSIYETVQKHRRTKK